MYCRLSYISKGALPLKTPAPLYICISIKQYNHLTFGGTPLSNSSGLSYEATRISRRYQKGHRVWSCSCWLVVFCDLFTFLGQFFIAFHLYLSLITVAHTNQFQKCGLPHSHILVWQVKNGDPLTPGDIDVDISAELPDPLLDPLGFSLVQEFMLHGPCGDNSQNSSCMKMVLAPNIIQNLSDQTPHLTARVTHFIDNGTTESLQRKAPYI
jgi:hypothetical protein